MTFDWLNPDYVPIFQERADRLAWLRADKSRVDALKRYYRDHPADFINDWGMTFDPRNPEIGLPATIPFLLFDKQREWVEETIYLWKHRERGISEKSRDCGLSWLAVATGCTLCLFNDGLNIGYGSRKEEYVDKLDSPKSLFWKLRMFRRLLPIEFNGGFDLKADAPHMRMNFRETGSYITGEAGDGVGRGDRASIYFVDEFAFFERPQLVEASLSMTTNCRIDISSVNGRANPFAENRHSGKHRVFIFDWRDDPRKTQEWYDRQKETLDPVVLAQEVDRDYSASVEGVLIPSAWVEAAIDAHAKLGIAPAGRFVGGFDVADEGRDMCAYAVRQGVELLHLDEWSGKGSDTLGSTQRVAETHEAMGVEETRFDADGVGASVRSDARVINERRVETGRAGLHFMPYRGSAGVYRPRAQDEPGRFNEDFFKNRKAQDWWNLRRRFRATYRAVNGVAGWEPDEIISISPTLPLLSRLKGELSQPTWDRDTAGRIVIDKVPDGTRSPNLADAVNIAYSVGRSPMQIADDALK